jgi:hypothetical protein
VGVYTRQTFGPGRYEIWTMQSSWHNVPEVDQVPQAAGAGHASRVVRGLISADGAELAQDIAGAYPSEAGIGEWRRTIRLDRGSAGGGMILLTDAWQLDHQPDRIVLHLITARRPRSASPGRLLIPAAVDEAATDGAAALTISYPAVGFDAQIEERAVDDPRLSATWGPAVYRIILAARRPAREGSARLEIRPTLGVWVRVSFVGD